MARGNVAKDKVVEALKKVYGDKFIGEVNKKFYVWEDDGGEQVQIAIALTCPKTFVEAETPETASTPDTVKPRFESTEISEQEKSNIIDLMARLGL